MCLCAQVWSGLFTATPATREWALQTAPTLTLYIRRNEERTEEWLRFFARCARALATRAATPHLTTRVEVIINGAEVSRAESLRGFVHLLACHGACVTELAFYGNGTSDGASSVSIALSEIRTPNLVKVELHDCFGVFPAPWLLPSVREVVIDYTGDDVLGALPDVYASVAPFLPQLTSLTVNESIDSLGLYSTGPSADKPEPKWKRLFNKHSTTRTLKKFSTTGTLTDTLLNLILKHAAVTHLCVGDIDIEGEYKGRKWLVGCIETGKGLWEYQIAKLPTSKAEGRVRLVCVGSEEDTMRLCVEQEVSVYVTHTHTHTITQKYILRINNAHTHVHTRARTHTQYTHTETCHAVPFCAMSCVPTA